MRGGVPHPARQRMELALLDGHVQARRQLQGGTPEREGAKGRRDRVGVGTRRYRRGGGYGGLGVGRTSGQEVHGEALSVDCVNRSI